MQKFSVIYTPKVIKHATIFASSPEDLAKKLGKMSHIERSLDTKFFQSDDGSMIEIETLDCDSLDLDDFDIEEMED